MSFNLEIVTPRGIYLTEEVSSLNIKLTSGYRTFLTGHAPLIGSIGYGPMHIVKDGKIIYFAVHGGAINVTKEKTILIVNAIERAKDIDIARAKASKERALKRLDSKDNNIDLKRAQLSLERSIARLQAAEYR